MDGRLENQKKYEKRTHNMMDGQPDIVKEYYVYLNDKTSKTKFMYINRIINFLRFIKDSGFDVNDINEFQKIKPSNINDYMESIRYKENGGEYSESYRALQLNVIKSFFQFLEDEEYVLKNPSVKLKAPRVSNQTAVTYLTQKEIKQIKKNMEEGFGSKRERAAQQKWIERDTAIMALALGTGLRVAALTEININDINFEEHTIRVTEKENITKDIYISDDVEKALKVWLNKRKQMLSKREDNSNGALFISFKMNRLNPDGVNDVIKKYTYNIDKKITAHKLRSTFGMNVYEATGDIFITSELLGHSNIETTKRYATVTEEKKRNAVDKISKKIF